MIRISIVVPCYNSEKTITQVVNEIQGSLNILNETYEIILVDDASADDVFLRILQLARTFSNIKGIRLAKNFGQHAAIMAGLHYATGDFVICLDDDGQTPAQYIPLLLKEIEKGYDLVFANYSNYETTLFRKIGTFANNLMAEWLIQKPKDISISSYFIAKKFIIHELLKFDGPFPYISGLLLRSTKRISKVIVPHNVRLNGSSGYTLHRLFSLWLNGFTAFSIKPLRVSSLIGMSMALSGFLYGLTVIYRRLTNPLAPLGYASLISAVIFSSGIIMMMLGMIGEYVGRIYLSLNKAPQYIIRDTINTNEK